MQNLSLAHRALPKIVAGLIAVTGIVLGFPGAAASAGSAGPGLLCDAYLDVNGQQLPVGSYFQSFFELSTEPYLANVGFNSPSLNFPYITTTAMEDGSFVSIIVSNVGPDNYTLSGSTNATYYATGVNSCQ